MMRGESGALLGLAQACSVVGNGSGWMSGLRGGDGRRIGGERRRDHEERESEPDNGSGERHIAGVRPHR